MTQKKNDNTTGTTGTQSSQGNIASKGQGGKDVNPNQQKGQGQGSNIGGSQMGGKSSPAGGPETFESDQVNQGKSNQGSQGGQGKAQGGQQGGNFGKGQERTTQGGQQSGRSDPYPPVNPDRPVMAGGQSGQGQQKGQSYGGSQAGQGSQLGQGGGKAAGSAGFGAQGNIANPTGAKGATGTELEEEE